MDKIYLAQLNANFQKSGCIIDLNNLPPGVHSDIVSHPWEHGIELAAYVQADPERFERIISAINNSKLNDEAIDFLTSLASFWQNLPPSPEEKDALLTSLVASNKVDFVRTSPEVAITTWRGLMRLA